VRPGGRCAVRATAGELRADRVALSVLGMVSPPESWSMTSSMRAGIGTAMQVHLDGDVKGLNAARPDPGRPTSPVRFPDISLRQTVEPINRALALDDLRVLESRTP
jgi:hypothetical protein